MTEVDYADPPRCRTDEDASFGCDARPRWVVETRGRDGSDYTDYLCGRHLAGFLMAVLGHGSSALVTADYGYGPVVSPVPARHGD